MSKSPIAKRLPSVGSKSDQLVQELRVKNDNAMIPVILESYILKPAEHETLQNPYTVGA